MLNIIKRLLLKIVGDIDTGNSNLSEEEINEVINVLQNYTDKTVRFSKYQACKYLNMSRATFDNYVRKGEIPKGIKEAGFTELFWEKKALDKFKESKKS